MQNDPLKWSCSKRFCLCLLICCVFDPRQVGTVQDDPLERPSERLTNAQRKSSLTGQLLADSTLTVTRKKRYAAIQEEATRFQKVKKRKTGQPRNHPPKHRPKH